MKKLLVLIIIAASAGMAIFTMYNSPPDESSHRVFQVDYGETVRSTAQKLQREHLIRNDDFFVLLSYMSRRKYIKAGKYELFKFMTSMEILKKLTRGQILTASAVIPEGFNLYQIAERLDKKGICDQGKFLHYAFDEDFLASRSIHATSAEGYLYPDTYRFAQGSDARDVIARMAAKMNAVLSELYHEHGRPSMGTHRLLTLASLVEEEARIPSERMIIASVFHNRLKRNMRMDCDPTVRYAVKKFSGRLTYNDLESDSPFNTYRRTGLPPTPISSPGRESIEAAINPEKTAYLFFVARNDGSHYFSTTLRQHNQAVDFYQKGINNGFRDNQKF